MKKIYFCEGIELTPIACAYIRARGADRMSSYGDFAALSEECDEATARFLSKEVSDGVIAPSYSEKALEILRAKRKGTYLVLQMDPNYTPKPMESKEVYGVRFHQQRNDVKIDKNLLQNIVSENKELPEGAKRDLLIAMITAKYTPVSYTHLSCRYCASWYSSFRWPGYSASWAAWALSGSVIRRRSCSSR